MAGNGSRDVDAYIAAAPLPARRIMRELRRIIREVVPEATEYISYRMPYYSFHGRLIYFAAQRTHVGLYMLGRAQKKYARELAPYLSGASTARFPLDKPLPAALVRKIMKERRAENLERAKKAGR